MCTDQRPSRQNRALLDKKPYPEPPAKRTHTHLAFTPVSAHAVVRSQLCVFEFCDSPSSRRHRYARRSGEKDGRRSKVYGERSWSRGRPSLMARAPGLVPPGRVRSTGTPPTRSDTSRVRPRQRCPGLLCDAVVVALELAVRARGRREAGALRKGKAFWWRRQQQQGEATG